MMFCGTGLGMWFYGVIGLGICALMVRAALEVWQRRRPSEDTQEGAGRSRLNPLQAQAGSPSWDARVFRLAESKGGSLTVSDLVVAAGVEVAKAERILDDISDGVRVRMTVTDEGIVRYEFPEIQDLIARDVKEEAR